MRFLKGIVLSLLPLVVVAAAKKPAVDKYQQFHTKALVSAPLKLDDSAYARLTATPRDYSVAILLTALEARFGCALCREFQPEWELLSKSWTKGDKKGESRLIYGTLDFTDGKATFQSVRTIYPKSRNYANESISSLVFKLHLFFYSSCLQPDHTLPPEATTSDLISQAGEQITK